MKQKQIKQALVYLALALAAVFFVGPIFWLFISSLKPRVELFDVSLPKNPTLESYRAVIDGYPVMTYLSNSVIVAVVTGLVAVLLGSLAAYAFARYRFRGGQPMFFSAFVLRMLPGMALLIPFYMLFNRFGLHNTLTGLVVANVAFNIPFVIWTLYGFFQDIPVELEEAGRIDGCNRIGVLRHIVWPLAAPGLAVTGIFVFINAWNEFNFAVVLTSTDASKTMPVALAGMSPEYGINWDFLSAAGMLYIIPTLILTFFIQRYLVKGLTAGAVKG